MSRSGTFSSGVLVVFMACSGSGSDPAEPRPASQIASVTSAVSTAVAPTPLEGEWKAVVTARGMKQTGFSAAQIRADQRHEGWSSRYDVDFTVTGDRWVLTEASDGDEPILGAFGPLSVAGNRVQITDAKDGEPCTVVFDYQAEGDDLSMTFVRGNCGEAPIEPIPDFMYAAVFVQPFHRVG